MFYLYTSTNRFKLLFLIFPENGGSRFLVMLIVTYQITRHHNTVTQKDVNRVKPLDI